MDNVNENKDQLEVKYAQLSLEFSEEENVFAPFYKIQNSDGKVYLPLELVKFSFFLHARSEKVLVSRKGYKAYQKYKELNKKGLSEKEIRKETEFKTSPTDLRKNFKNWQIIAHQDWGLPDSFDGHVWDVIINLISNIMQKSGKFYLIYTITPNMIEAELIRRGVYKSRSGKTAMRIKDAVNRLKNTTYIYEKGNLRKDTGEYINKEEYDFRLITNVYEKGEIMADGKYATKFAIAIDPLVILNLRHNHFLIVLNKRRGQLKEYESIILFDKLSYFVYQDMANEGLFKSMQLGLKPYRKLSYFKVCEYLGTEARSGINYKKSQVEEHLKAYHKELLSNSIIDEIIIQEKGKGINKKFNLIYIFKREFLVDMFDVLSKEGKLKQRDYTPDERKQFMGFVQQQIDDPKLVRRLFE
jgi:hypothetical protein